MKRHNNYFFEFISILLGVTIALVINTLWEDYEHEKLAQKASDNLLIEVQKNLEEVDSVLSIHKQSNEAIEQLLLVIEKKKTNPSYEPDEEADFVLQFPLLTNSAWETAKLSGAVTYMKYEKVSDFNSIYKLQDMYEHTIENFMKHSFTSLQLLEEEQKLIQMKSFIENIIMSEENFIDNYNKILKEHKAN